MEQQIQEKAQQLAKTMVEEFAKPPENEDNQKTEESEKEQSEDKPTE